MLTGLIQNRKMFRLLVFVSIFASSFCEESKVYQIVYQNIERTSFDTCVRLMNGTHQIGCQSSLDGDVGILYHVNDSSSIDQVLSGTHPPYVALMHANLFNKTVVRKYKSSGVISGIIVYLPDQYFGPTKGWSPELQCPRNRFQLYTETYGRDYGQCEKDLWNAIGDGLTEEDIPFPVFILKNYSSTLELIQCHDEHNSDGEFPFCATQMKARMDGAQSTRDCVRRNQLQNNLSPAAYCDELGGKTIFATLKATNSSTGSDESSNIFVAAGLDSRSFEVTEFAPGVNSATGFITLLATARALGSLDQSAKDAMPKNVLFAIFDGEAFDNMGSSRMVFDMSRNEFPNEVDPKKWQSVNYNTRDISHYIEFGQLGMRGANAWVHYDPVSYEDTEIKTGVDEIFDSLKSHEDNISFIKQSQGIGLVPSSLQSILKVQNVSGVVLSDYNKTFSNRFYFSRFDTLDKLGIGPPENATEEEALVHFKPLAEKLSRISSSVSQTIYKLSTGNDNKNIKADTYFIQRMLYCYTYRRNCSLFKEVIQVGTTVTLINKPYSRYVGVYKDKLTGKGLSWFTRNLLTKLVGETMDANTSVTCTGEDNDEIYQYLFLEGSFANASSRVCYRAPVYVTDGRSPSTVIANYDFSNGLYGAWSESRWGKSAFSLKIFLVQDKVSQGMILLSGLLMFLSSLVIVYIINKKSDILFANEVL